MSYRERVDSENTADISPEVFATPATGATSDTTSEGRTPTGGDVTLRPAVLHFDDTEGPSEQDLSSVITSAGDQSSVIFAAAGSSFRREDSWPPVKTMPATRKQLKVLEGKEDQFEEADEAARALLGHRSLEEQRCLQKLEALENEVNDLREVVTDTQSRLAARHIKELEDNLALVNKIHNDLIRSSLVMLECRGVEPTSVEGRQALAEQDQWLPAFREKILPGLEEAKGRVDPRFL